MDIAKIKYKMIHRPFMFVRSLDIKIIINKVKRKWINYSLRILLFVGIIHMPFLLERASLKQEN